MKPEALLLIALVPFAAAGCDSGGGEAGADSEPSAYADSLPDAALPASSTGALVTVTLEEWNIRLAQDTVSAGPVTLRTRNIGEVVHGLQLEGQGEEFTTGPVQPGEWATLEVTLEPGRYRVYCPIDTEDHVNRTEQVTQEWLVARPAAGADEARAELR